MKKLLLLAFVGFVMAQCSNDFDVSAPWKEVPVVYGILSPKDTAHYIRIEKAFLDENVSALEIARIADSLYYPEGAITVFLEEKGNASTKVQLSRVDGVKEGITRAEGIFATQPNWLYKYKNIGTTPYIKPDKKYSLIIKRTDGKPDITAETTIPGNFIFQVPNPQALPARINFSKNGFQDISWRTTESGVYFNITLIVRYRDEDAMGNTLARHELIWPALKNTRRSNVKQTNGLYNADATLTGAAFFDFLTQNIPASIGEFRYFERMDMILEGGGLEIEQLVISNNINAGITGSEASNAYTNISEGFGILTGKNVTSLTNVFLGSVTVDSMNTNILTRPLNFKY